MCQLLLLFQPRFIPETRPSSPSRQGERANTLAINLIAPGSLNSLPPAFLQCKFFASGNKFEALAMLCFRNNFPWLCFRCQGRNWIKTGNTEHPGQRQFHNLLRLPSATAVPRQCLQDVPEGNLTKQANVDLNLNSMRHSWTRTWKYTFLFDRTGDPAWSETATGQKPPTHNINCL